MDNRDNEIIKSMNELEKYILTVEFNEEAQETSNWGGADVVIEESMSDCIKNWLGDQPLVISHQKMEPRRRAVITPYAKELSLLFCKLRDIFIGKIDYTSKYDFYGILAQSAIDYKTENPEEYNKIDLLKTVINQAHIFLRDN